MVYFLLKFLTPQNLNFLILSMNPKDEDGMADSEDPDQNVPPGTVWSESALISKQDVSVQKYPYLACLSASK